MHAVIVPRRSCLTDIICMSSKQIHSFIIRRSVKPLLRCSNFWISKLSVVRHLQFSKDPNFNHSQGRGPIYASTCKFRDDQSNRSCVMAIYLFSKWWPSAILFFKYQFFYRCVEMPSLRHHDKFYLNLPRQAWCNLQLKLWSTSERFETMHSINGAI